MSDADQSKPVVSPAQARRATKTTSMQEKEKELLQQLDQTRRKQLEIARITAGKEASRKRRCLLVGQQLLIRARTDPSAASLVLSLIAGMSPKDQLALESIKAQLETQKSENAGPSGTSEDSPQNV